MNNIHITMNNKLLTYTLSALLFVFPVHLVFIFLKNLLYDFGVLKGENVGAKVISIGNIALGGTGKTPTTIAIANFLEKNGYSVGIVSRGHGRENISNDFLLKISSGLMSASISFKTALPAASQSVCLSLDVAD